MPHTEGHQFDGNEENSKRAGATLYFICLVLLITVGDQSTLKSSSCSSHTML